MSDLPEFLLARLGEDESLAQSAGAFTGQRPEPTSGDEVWAVLHEERWVPSRVLAEVEAKRRIVEEARQYGPNDPGSAMAAWSLRSLAAIYADHPDYREEWKP